MLITNLYMNFTTPKYTFSIKANRSSRGQDPKISGSSQQIDWGVLRLDSNSPTTVWSTDPKMSTWALFTIHTITSLVMSQKLVTLHEHVRRANNNYQGLSGAMGLELSSSPPSLHLNMYRTQCGRFIFSLCEFVSSFEIPGRIDLGFVFTDKDTDMYLHNIYVQPTY